MVERFLDLVLELWKYGIHEKTGKMGENYGVLNEEVVLIDLFELRGNKEKVRKQIKNNYLEKRHNLKFLSEEIKDYFVERSRQKISEENLEKSWKKKVY